MNELDDAVKLAQWFVAQPRLYTDNACVLAQQLLRMVEENVRLTAKIGAMAATDQAEQRINFAAGNAAADDPGCTKESVRAAAAIMASSRPSLAAQAEAVDEMARAKSYVNTRDDISMCLVHQCNADALSAAAATLRAVPGLVETLERIGRTRDCGCNPCRGQCTSREALLVEAEEMRDFARVALRRLAGEREGE